MKDYDPSDFENYISELRSLFQEDPDIATKELYYFKKRLSTLRENKQPEKIIARNRIIYSIVFSVLIALTGLTVFDSYAMFFGGLLFFLSGHFIGMYIEKAGLIFLFSHSVTGMCIMIASLIGGQLKGPILSDLSYNALAYLVICLLLFIIATIYVIVYNLSDKLKIKPYANLVPLSLYFIAFLMTGLFNYIV